MKFQKLNDFLWICWWEYAILPYHNHVTRQEECALSQASVQNLQEKQIIFLEGDVDKNFYKIISGKVAFYINYGIPGETLLGTSSAPHYFGTMNVLTGKPATYTAVAIEHSMILYLPESELETFPKSDPHNAVAAMKALAEALSSREEKLHTLLSELRHVIRSGGRSDALSKLADSYADELENHLVLDEYTPIQMPAVETSAVPKVKKLDGEMPEPYLKGHRSSPGVTHPEYKHYLIHEDYTCPHCQRKFTGNRIQVSKLVPIRDESESHRYDLRVRYNDFETEWHEIVTCPHCYFSSFDNFFRESKTLYKSRYESKLAQLCDYIAIDFNAEKDLDTVFAQHYLALTCAPGFSDSRQIIARIWMNLVRLYRDAGELELSGIAEQNALDAYNKVYMEVDLTEGQEQRLCLTVAGILFARGDKLEAREWATRVRSGSDDHSAYWSLAEQLIQDVRAELSE